MTSRRSSKVSTEPRRSPRLQNTPDNPPNVSIVVPRKPQENAPTPENETPAQRISRSRARIKSTLKISKSYSMIGKTTGKSMLATPYRTPRLNKVPWHRYAARTSEKKKDAKKWNENLKGLMQKSMKLCYLSSLTSFKYKEEKLRRKYEKTLKNKILEVYPSPVVKVSFTVTSCLSWESSVVDTVCIEVSTMVPGDTAEQDRMVITYYAWLIHTRHIQSSDLKNVQWLPVMLYSGRELIHQVFVDWLQGSFDCYVTRSCMRQSDLLWMSGLCSKLKCRKSSHNLEDCKIEFNFSITTPYGTNSFSSPNNRGKPRIAIKLPLKEIHEIWERLGDKTDDEVSLDDLQKFLSQIHHVASRCGLSSSRLRLQLMRTPCVVLRNTGKVRLLCQHNVAGVIQCFMEVFLQMTNSYKPYDYNQDLDKEDTLTELNNNVQ